MERQTDFAVFNVITHETHLRACSDKFNGDYGRAVQLVSAVTGTEVNRLDVCAVNNGALGKLLTWQL